MSKKTYVLPSDKQLDKNVDLLTKDKEAELTLCGILLEGFPVEREAWLDTFYRVRVSLGPGKDVVEVITPGKVLKNIRNYTGKHVVLKCKMFSKSNGVRAKAYIMAKEAMPSKEKEFINTVSMDGFVLSAPETRRGVARFPMMIPHYSGIHNVFSCLCDANLIATHKIKYGTQLQPSGRLVCTDDGYMIEVNKL